MPRCVLSLTTAVLVLMFGLAVDVVSVAVVVGIAVVAVVRLSSAK